MSSDRTYRTEQEAFWAGEFGIHYSLRNSDATWVASNSALFSEIFALTGPLASVFEIGANIGLNVRAIQGLLPQADVAALEINDRAADELKKTGCTVFRDSALSFRPPRQFDLAFTKGLLIHIHPKHLVEVYRLLYESSSRYLLVAEYYNPRPEELTYRGNSGKLFRRDFAGELLDTYLDLGVVRTGFAYHRSAHPQDDLTWFLLEKRS